MANASYPHLQAAVTAKGIDWQAFLQQLLQTVGPVVVALIEQLLGKLNAAKKAGVKCPSGDCSDVVCQLDRALANSTDTICALICAKNCCQPTQPC